MNELHDCPLCNRTVAKVTDHHLVPQSRGGKTTLPICQDCHNSIHSFFTNKELESTFNTVDALLADEKFGKHIKWLSKQDPSRRYKSKRVKNKQKRGRSG